MKLTVNGIRALKGNGERQVIADGGGLYLRVSPSGEKTWLVRYTVKGGKQRDEPLAAPFGDKDGPGVLTLAEARALAANVRALAREGVDYFRAQDAQRKEDDAAAAAARERALSVRALFEAWIKDGVRRKDGGKELRRRFEKDVLPALGARELRTVVESDVRAVFAVVVARDASAYAVDLLWSVKQMFGWGFDRLPWRRLMEIDPTASIDPDSITAADYVPGESTRALEEQEIPELARKMRDLRAACAAGKSREWLDMPVRLECAVWAMLSTLCRVGELTQARVTDLDLYAGTWVIPPEHSKNGDGFCVFLSDFARTQFATLADLAAAEGSPWLFPSVRNAQKHIDLKNIAKNLGGRQGQTDDWEEHLRIKAKGTHALILSGGTWTPHDLRRTGATLMQALGVMPAVIDKCQNHRNGKDEDGNKISGSVARIRATYQRYRYAPQMREAWRLLGERLDLLTREDAANVVLLGAA